MQHSAKGIKTECQSTRHYFCLKTVWFSPVSPCQILRNKPGEIKTKEVNVAKKGRTFYFTYKKGADWVLSPPNWGRDILKDHICVVHGALWDGLLWDNISRPTSHFLQRLFPLQRSFPQRCPNLSIGGNISNTLEIDIHLKNTTSFIFSQLRFFFWPVPGFMKHYISFKKKVEKRHLTITRHTHTWIKTDFHSWFIHQL